MINWGIKNTLTFTSCSREKIRGKEGKSVGSKVREWARVKMGERAEKDGNLGFLGNLALLGRRVWLESLPSKRKEANEA